MKEPITKSEHRSLSQILTKCSKLALENHHTHIFVYGAPLDGEAAPETALLLTFLGSQIDEKKRLFLSMSHKISSYRAIKCVAILKIAEHLDVCMMRAPLKWEIAKQRSCRLLDVAMVDDTNLLFRFCTFFTKTRQAAPKTALQRSSSPCA